MRKFSKILTVFLTVCLLAGVVTATVVSADASSTITTIKSSATGAFTPKTPKNWVRKSIKTTLGEEENEYYRYYRSNGTHDLTLAPGGYHQYTGTGSFKDYAYVVHDFDLMSDMYLNAEGNLSSEAGAKLAYQDGLYFYHARHSAHKCYVVEDSDGLWYVANASTYDAATAKVPLSSEVGVWNHISYVADIKNAVSYYFVNGQFLSSVTGFGSTKSITNFYLYPNATNMAQFSFGIDNIKITGYGTADGYADTDNIAGNSIADYFGGTVDTSIPLYNCDDMVYNSNYTYVAAPAGQVVATVNGTGYHVLAGALKALKGLSGEATLNTKKSIVDFEIPETIDKLNVICTDGARFSYKGAYILTLENTKGDTTTYVVEKARSVNAEWLGSNGETISDEPLLVLISSNAVFIPDEIADVYTTIKGTPKYEWKLDDGDYTEFVPGAILDDGVTKITVRPATATVTWKGIEGLSDNEVENWFIGSTLEAGDLTRFSSYEENDGNGWYVIKYSAWDGYIAGMTVENDEYTFTPQLAPVAMLNDVKLNMSLLTKFEANLLISEAPSNVHITGVYSNADRVDNLLEALRSLELDGENYLVDSFFIDNSDVDKVFSRYVEYEVEYDGRKTVVVGEVKVSLLDYAEKVIAQYGCGSKEANLVYNLINYANAAYALKSGTDYEDAIAFLALEGHEDGCACNTTYAYLGEEVYYDFFYEEFVLGENVYAVSFDVSGEQPAFVVYVMLDEFGNALADVRLDFNGIFGTEVGDVALNLVRGDDITIEGVGTFATLFFEDMPLYNATEIFTITATDATTGEVSVCNYSLATYIDFFYMMGVDASDRGLAVAEALYSFAKVAKDYKLN